MSESENVLTVAHAVRAGQLEVVRTALNAGADSNSQDADGLPLLSVAAAHGHEAVVELLLERGARPNESGWHGVTPLMAAANGGHHQVVDTLLRASADLEARDDAGN